MQQVLLRIFAIRPAVWMASLSLLLATMASAAPNTEPAASPPAEAIAEVVTPVDEGEGSSTEEVQTGDGRTEYVTLQGEYLDEGNCQGSGSSWFSADQALGKARQERRECLSIAEDECYARGVNTFVTMIDDPPENPFVKCKQEEFWETRCLISASWICIDAYL